VPTILVVDDEPAILRLLSLMLRDLGCEAITAGDAETALDRLSGVDPSLIISDIRLPGMSGLEFADRVKSDARFSAVPIVLISAFGEPNGGGHAGDGFLAKPFDIESLTDVLRTYLEIN